MPDRMIRDELLTSRRYWSVSPLARCLYLAILLTADDTARADGDPFALAQRMAYTVKEPDIQTLLNELSTADLIRPYQNGRYLFVPRFRQRMRYPNSKFPEPPKQIMELDDTKTDSSHTHAGPKTYQSPTLVRPKTHEVKRSEVKRSEEKETLATHTVPESVPKPQVKDSIEKLAGRITGNPRHEATPEDIERERQRQLTLARKAMAEQAAKTATAAPGSPPASATPAPKVKPPAKPNGHPKAPESWEGSDETIMAKAVALGIDIPQGSTFATVRALCKQRLQADASGFE